MYSVFLVEDEIVVREGIKQLIEWEEYGFTFVGEAPDGELAWASIQKVKPDIVITDIKMPFMDGLELSKLIKTNLPNTVIIILSGYDEFSYAKSAINIGVNQYLLKPLSKDQIIEVLIEVKKKKDNERLQEKYNQEFADEVQEYLTSSRRVFFDALVSGSVSVPVLLERAQKLGLDLVAERYNIVLFLLESDVLNNNLSIIDEIQNQIAQEFSQSDKYVLFNAGMDVTAFLVKGTDDDIKELTSKCQASLNEICENHKDKIHYVTAAGQPVSRLSVVKTCYKSTRSILFYGSDYVSNQQDKIQLYDSIRNSASSLDFNPNEMEASKLDPSLINKFLSNALPEDIDSFVESYFDGFGKKSIQSVLFRHYIVLNIQFAVNAFVERLGLRDDYLNKDNDTKLNLQLALQSLGNSKKYVAGLFNEVLKMRDKTVTNKYQGMLTNVINYMKDNYANSEIGLNAVAKIAHMTPTHFSTVFSRQTGETFVEYLTELRMEKARELLRCTSESSSEIAIQVGYNDPHYFSFLFKKINGCSPRDYRNKKVKKAL